MLQDRIMLCVNTHVCVFVSGLCVRNLFAYDFCALHGFRFGESERGFVVAFRRKKNILREENGCSM